LSSFAKLYEDSMQKFASISKFGKAGADNNLLPFTKPLRKGLQTFQRLVKLGRRFFIFSI